MIRRLTRRDNVIGLKTGLRCGLFYGFCKTNARFFMENDPDAPVFPHVEFQQPQHAAGFFVARSDLGVAPKLVVVLACITVGAMGFISPVLLFFRYRLVLKGQPTRVQVAKMTQFSLLTVVAVAAYITTIHLMYRQGVG